MNARPRDIRHVEGQVWITYDKNFAHWTDRKWQTMYQGQRLELEWRSGFYEDAAWYLYSDSNFGIKLDRRLVPAMKSAIELIDKEGL